MANTFVNSALITKRILSRPLCMTHNRVNDGVNAECVLSIDGFDFVPY